MPDIFASLVPIVAIVMGIGIGFWRVYWDHQRKRLQYEERRLMIEKGQVPPPMPPDTGRRSPQSSLRSGILLVSLGIGLAVAYGVIQGPQALTQPVGRNQFLVIASAVVLLLGAGHLVYYRLAKDA